MVEISPGSTVNLTKQQAQSLYVSTSGHALATGLGPITIKWRRNSGNTGPQDSINITANVVKPTELRTIVLQGAATSWQAPDDLYAVTEMYAIGPGGNGGNGVVNTSSGGSGGSGEFRGTTDFSTIQAEQVYEIATPLGGSQSPALFKDSEGVIILQANAGTNASGVTAGVGGNGGVGDIAFAGTNGSNGSSNPNVGGSGSPGAPGNNGLGKAGGTKTTGRAGAGGGGANGGLSTVGNNGLGYNNSGAPGGNNRQGSGSGAGGTSSTAAGIGSDGGGSGGAGPYPSNNGKGADAGFDPLWQLEDSSWYGPGGGAGGGGASGSDAFAGNGGNGKFGSGGAGGANSTTKFGQGGTGGDSFIIIKYLTGPLAELGPSENLYPSLLWDSTLNSGWIAGTEPQTTSRGEDNSQAPQPMVTCNFVDWLTYNNDMLLAINAEAVGGINRVEVELAGNKKTLYFKTLETIIGRNGVPRKSWAYHVRLDHAKAMAFGYDRGMAKLRITAYANNPAFDPRTLPPYTLYPRANEWDVVKTVAIDSGYSHPDYGIADYSGPNGLRDAVANAANYNDRLKVVCIQNGTYNWAPSNVSIDNPNYWITVTAADDVNVVLGDGSRPGGVTVGGTEKSQLKVDMLHIMGENIEFSVSGMANDGGSAITQRSGTLGRYWFDGCWLGWEVPYAGAFSSGIGAAALVNGKQPSPTWLYAGVQGGAEVNTFFTEVRVRSSGAAASGIGKYRLAWYCDIPYCSGTAYENPASNSSTYYCTAKNVGGYLPGLRVDNDMFSIKYTGAGANPTLRVLTAVGGGATNGTADQFILTAGGVSDTYTVSAQGHNPATFVAWANALGKGWVLTNPTTPCLLSLAFASREVLNPAQPWGTGLTNNELPITSSNQLVTAKMDIHANCLVTTPGNYNQLIFGFHGEPVGAAPWSVGTGTRRDFFMVNSSFIDKGHLFVNPVTGLAMPISPQSGYVKSGSADHHTGIWNISMPNTSWFYGTGGGDDPPYVDYGYNNVHSVVAKNIGYLAKDNTKHSWTDIVMLVETQAYVNSVADDPSVSKGYGTGVTNVSSVTLEAGFVDPESNLTPKADSWVKLSNGSYAGRYDADGNEQAIG